VREDEQDLTSDERDLLAHGLGVEPGDLPNACKGSSVAESAVGALLVVVTHPVWQ